MSRRLLLIDDDKELARLLRVYFGRHGYPLEWADRPSTGLEMMAARPDLVLLDVNLPENDGFTVCRQLRELDAHTPIIMLTARGESLDRVQGLRSGADDYVPKPFDPLELLARVEAVLRRSSERAGEQPEAPGRLDNDRKVLWLAGREIPLTHAEYRLLTALTANPGKLFSRDKLLDLLDEAAVSDATDRAIDVHISRLRTKLEPDPRHPRHLLTERGLGYRFEW